MIDLDVRILDERLRGALPAHATPGSAGVDLRACIDAPLEVAPGQAVLIPTGLAIHVADPGYAGLVLPRSGLGHRHGLVLGNLVGLIDADYQGPLMVSCWNRHPPGHPDARPYVVQPLERIAQLVVVPVRQVRLRVVDAFESTGRGEAGFGSTGTR